MTHSELISEIERYATLQGIAPATVTSRAVGNSRLYARLKAGKGCTIKVATRLLSSIKDGEAAMKAEAAE